MDKTVEIVIMAMVAAFLGLRLYSVLGRRAEHEEKPIQGRIEPEALSLKPAKPIADQGDRGGGPRAMVPGVTPAIERGLREISAADRRFDLLAFVEGARGAYRMVLEAFWAGDRDALKNLCEADVYAAFAAAIDERESRGERLENRLVRIDDATVVAVSYDAPVARIAVRFTADVAAITRNAEGQVVAGSLTDAVEARDLWTFSRDIMSAAPDWLLDETDEA